MQDRSFLGAYGRTGSSHRSAHRDCGTTRPTPARAPRTGASGTGCIVVPHRSALVAVDCTALCEGFDRRHHEAHEADRTSRSSIAGMRGRGRTAPGRIFHDVPASGSGRLKLAWKNQTPRLFSVTT